jgi:hypothetical protein
VKNYDAALFAEREVQPDRVALPHHCRQPSSRRENARSSSAASRVGLIAAAAHRVNAARWVIANIIIKAGEALPPSMQRFEQQFAGFANRVGEAIRRMRFAGSL